MSNKAVGNYSKRRNHRADKIVRAMCVRERDEQFQADMGVEPMTPAQVFELAADGLMPVWRRKHGQWVATEAVLPMGADCYRELDSGELAFSLGELAFSLDVRASSLAEGQGAEYQDFLEKQAEMQLDAAWLAHNGGQQEVFLADDMADADEGCEGAVHVADYAWPSFSRAL